MIEIDKTRTFKSENPINKFVILNNPFKVIGVFEDVDGIMKKKLFMYHIHQYSLLKKIMINLELY